MPLHILTSFFTSVGKVRKKNEDNIYYNGIILPENHLDDWSLRSDKVNLKDGPACFSVFDGMGGEVAGERASYTAAETMMQERKKLVDISSLQKVYEQINLRVCEVSENLPFGRTGSTGVTLLFLENKVIVCNLGDSSAFRFHEGVLQKVSSDHLEILPEGVTRKKRLIQYFGIFQEEARLVPSIAEFPLQDGDAYLLCSDGLTDMVLETEIESELKKNRMFPNKVASKLIEKALEAGGRDNITVIFCQVKK